MNFEQIANKYPNPNRQNEANKNQQQRSSEKRKFNSDQLSPPLATGASYPNKKQRLSENAPSFQNNHANDNDIWKQYNKQFSANNRLKKIPQRFPINRAYESHSDISKSPQNDNLITYRNYSSDGVVEQPRWGHNEQAKITNTSLNSDNNYSRDSGGYWNNAKHSESYSANNRLKKIRADMHNRSGSDKTEGSSDSSIHEPVRNNFSNKPQTITRSSQRDTNSDFNQWRNEKNHFSDNSESPEVRNRAQSHSSSSLGSQSSQRNKNAPVPKFNIQERLNNIRNSHKSDKPFYSKNKTTNYLGPVGGGWHKPIDVEQQARSRIYNNNNKTYYNQDTLPSTSTANVNRLRSESNSNLNNNNRYSQSDYVSSPEIYPNDNLSTSSINYTTDEEMEWSDIDERELLSDLKDLRRNFNSTKVPLTNFQEIMARDAIEIAHNKTIVKSTYIVVDTNIFLSNLKLIEQIMETYINGVLQLMILVPWIVIQELDHIKDRQSETKAKLRLHAQKAICFINKCLIDKKNLKGQSVRDAVQQDFVTSNFDDGILHCCMQVRERNNRPILLSNDVNLRNKLLTESIEAYGSKDIIQKIDPFYCVQPASPHPSSTKLEHIPETNPPELNIRFIQIQTKLSDLLNFILSRETQRAYGEEACSRMKPLQNWPWSLETCMDIFERYWASLFYMDLHNQVLNNVKAFKKFIHSKVSDIKTLVDLSLALCIGLRTGYKNYRDIIADFTNWIHNYDR